jgi:rod shape-determining protein MreD
VRSAGTIVRVALVLAVLTALHFYLRPRLGDSRLAPDFILLALLLLALRVRPGAGAVAGFLVGLVLDALAPTAFGAAALACTIVGFASGWVRTMFVADNALVTALFVLVAAWLRDVIQVTASNQLAASAALRQLLIFSPLAALTTAVAGLITMLLVGGWLTERRRA